MKVMKKFAAAALTAALTVGTVITSHADYTLHCIFGTERTYGEYSTPTGALYDAKDHDSKWDLADHIGDSYYILPKTDTVTFDLPESHNVEIRWWLRGVVPREMEDGSIGLSWEDAPEKTENYVAGTEYAVFPAELQESSVNSWRGPIDDPFIIMTVTDYDLDWEWRIVYQVVDNWPGPVDVAEGAGAWESDEHGWRVRSADGYLVNAWYLSPESGLWYYLGADGYMLTNTTTPDGYTVNADGVWVS